MPITEKWITIRADANQYWDVAQNKIVSSPTVIVARSTQAAPGTPPPAPAQVVFHVSDADLASWTPGGQCEVTFNPVAATPQSDRGVPEPLPASGGPGAGSGTAKAT